MPPAMRFLLLPFYGTYLKRHYHIEYDGMDAVQRIVGPSLVLSNHVHTLDSFMISAGYPYHIRWVAGAYLFKNPFVGYLLTKWVHGIPKQQGRSDLQTIRSISSALKQGDTVGIFPEGTRTWDGDTLDIGQATAKLIKLFKVPVVFLHLEGGYALKPRWTDHDRKGAVRIKVVSVLTAEEIERLKISELTETVSRLLFFSQDAWQRKKNVPFPSKNQAQGLQRLLYLCPCCGGRSTLATSGSEIRCTSCGALANMDPFDRLHSGPFEESGGKFFTFKTVKEWHDWEQKKLADIMEQATEKETLFPEDQGKFFQKGHRNGFRTISKDFTVRMTKTTMSVVCDKPTADGTTRYDFAFSDIQSMIICAKQTLEFFIDDTLFRIRLIPEASSLKYQETYFAVRSRSARSILEGEAHGAAFRKS